MALSEADLRLLTVAVQADCEDERDVPQKTGLVTFTREFRPRSSPMLGARLLTVSYPSLGPQSLSEVPSELLYVQLALCWCPIGLMLSSSTDR